MDMLAPSVKMMVNDFSMLQRARMFSPAAPQEEELQAVCSTERLGLGRIHTGLGSIRSIKASPPHMKGQL